MLDEELEHTGYSIESIRHFPGVCIGWLVSHTLTEDQAIAGKVVSKWSDLPHEAEKEALEATVVQLAREMFHLIAKIVSEQ